MQPESSDSPTPPSTGPLWAPWRMEFITSDKSGECVFCERPRDPARSREHLVLARGERSFVLMNRYPYNNGHLMVIPYDHVSTIAALDDETALEVHHFLSRSIEALESLANAEGFNVGLNLGAAAGAGIAEHVHYHIVPRWSGDTNFMPVIGLTKTIPQHLLETYDLLFPRFQAGD